MLEITWQLVVGVSLAAGAIAGAIAYATTRRRKPAVLAFVGGTLFVPVALVGAVVLVVYFGKDLSFGP